MKKFIRGFIIFILTILLIILLTGLGVILSIKNIVIDAADSVVKNEISTNIVNTIENTTKIELPDNIVNEIEEVIKDNQEIKNVVASSLDMFVEIISNENSDAQINITKNLESIIDSGINILNENGIKIDNNTKQELFKVLSNKEVNNIITEVSKDIRNEMDEDTKLIIKIYNFITSNTLRLIIIGAIITSLLFIALLKKSSYSWLSNFAISSLISGLIVGIILPYLIKALITQEPQITISTNSLNTYGYTLIVLSIISIIINIIISKLVKKKKINYNTQNTEN